MSQGHAVTGIKWLPTVWLLFFAVYAFCHIQNILPYYKLELK